MFNRLFNQSIVRITAMTALLGSIATPVRALVHTITEIRIPMPDTHPGTGQPVELAADRYLPNSGTGPWPVILIQTPYGKGNSLDSIVGDRGADPLFNSPHYAWVVMDWRGTGSSGSENMGYDGCPPTDADGYEAVEWISRQSWCVPGRVGTWGASALGNIQARTAARRPPSLRCCVPMVYHFREWYDQCYPGGVYARDRNDFVYGLFGGLELVRSLPLKSNGWQLIEKAGRPSDLTVPMLHITGWYDHETLQTIREMQEIQTQGGPGAVGRQKLLVGPWAHGEVGLSVQNERSYPMAEFADSIEALAFFDHYLRDLPNNWEGRPAVRFFQMNADRWMESPSWPPASVDTAFHLHANRQLARPLPEDPANRATWTSDPADPAPSLCGALLWPPTVRQGPGDLSALDARPDLTYFETAPLHEPLAIAGHPRATLWVRCDAVDTDLHLRLTEVLPDGRAMLLVDAVRRASLRLGFTTRQWLAPDQDYEVPVDLPPVAVTIPVGHRLRLYVASANYDRFDVNQQDGSNLSDEPGATPIAATITLTTDAARPSRLILPVISPPEPDGDADGLPDWWEIHYFGNALSAGPAEDSDGDGVANQEERIALTDPTDPSSRLLLTIQPAPAPAGERACLLRWTSVAERDYAIYRSPDLVDWEQVGSRHIGTPPWNEDQVPGPQESAPAFFKVAPVP